MDDAQEQPAIDPRERLAATTSHYRQTEADHSAAQEAVIAAVIDALRVGITPSEVERLSPFSAAYIRRLAREQGVPPAPPGPKRGVTA